MIPVAIAVDGCAGLTSLPQFATDVENIAGMLSNAAPTLGTLAGIGSATIAKVQGLIATAKTVAASVTAAAAAGGSGIGALVSDFAGVFGSITAALGVNVPGLWGTVISAGVSLLPSILGAAGIPLAAGPGAPAPTMPVAQARAIAAALAGK